LVCTALERLKRNYLSQISRSGIQGLIDELDQLMNSDSLEPTLGVEPTPGVDTKEALPPGG
jgi:hypothetical protein